MSPDSGQFPHIMAGQSYLAAGCHKYCLKHLSEVVSIFGSLAGLFPIVMPTDTATDANWDAWVWATIITTVKQSNRKADKQKLEYNRMVSANPHMT